METNNEKAMPQPTKEKGCAKTWRREDLDHPKGPESDVWIECVQKPIEEAVTKWSNDNSLSFYVDFEFRKKDWPAPVKFEMDDVFKPFHPPAAGDKQECLNIVEEVSSGVWSSFKNEMDDFDFFTVRVFAVPHSEYADALSDYSWHYDD